jgi:hypothetical protein
MIITTTVAATVERRAVRRPGRPDAVAGGVEKGFMTLPAEVRLLQRHRRVVCGAVPQTTEMVE